MSVVEHWTRLADENLNHARDMISDAHKSIPGNWPFEMHARIIDWQIQVAQAQALLAIVAVLRGSDAE